MAKTKSQKRARPRSRLSSEEFAAIAKAVSDPTRYTILRHIADSSDCTCVELRDASAITAATLSHHLKELEAAGLIKIARRGKFAHPAFRRDTWNRYLAQLSTL